MTLESLPDLMPMDLRLSVFSYFTSHTALWVGNVMFLASLVTLAIGFRPRLSAIIATILHISFIHRNLAVAYGVDTISCFFLFFLCLADFRSDHVFRPGDWQAVLGSMAYRLCQIQICVIYGYSGLKKLKGIMWWNGDALWATLSQWQLARMDFSWLAHFPLLLAGLTFLTVAWEIYFPAVIWNRRARIPVLLMGVGMHLGIAIGLNLAFFGAFMIATYTFFLDRDQISNIYKLIKVPRLSSE